MSELLQLKFTGLRAVPALTSRGRARNVNVMLLSRSEVGERIRLLLPSLPAPAAAAAAAAAEREGRRNHELPERCVFPACNLASLLSVFQLGGFVLHP